jgi:UDP-2,4-diacetamido-2,4,6-trideoxy-beta-L-altropyranose hydrolase
MEVVVFRVDASRDIGGGHITRCLALADTLADTGWRCLFAVSADTIATLPWLCQTQHTVHILPAGREHDPRMLRPVIVKCSLLVIDHYKLDARYETSCRGWASRVLAIDDLADRPHDCDILLDQNLGRDPADYKSFVAPSTRVLAGSRFALLRPEFAAARPAALARRSAGIPLRRILVTLGYTDLGGVTARVVRAAIAAGTGATIDVVVDERAASLHYLRSVESERDDVAVHLNSSDMSRLMVEADIAIGAAGTTSWERCCLGVPSIVLVLAENQRLVARNLFRLGAVKLIESTGTFEPALIGLLLELVQSEATRLSLAQAAASVTDGMGTRRVVDEIVGRDRILPPAHTS